MSTLKKNCKSKCTAEDFSDFLNDTQSINDMPKNKTFKKRPSNNDKDHHNLLDIEATSSKRKKSVESFNVSGDSRQKTLNVMCKQLEVRRQANDVFLKSLSDVIANFEADYDVLKENEEKMEQLTGCFMKCMQQATAAHKEKLKSFKIAYAKFKNETEGLLLRGAIKPDDRPLWFDVYKAFPPTAEPKFARPKPQSGPVRQILYKEDIIRAKFHAKGHGLSVNMLNLTGETHIKKLVQSYQQLQSESLPEEELIQKAVETVVSSRQTDTQKPIANNPDSVTSKVLAEADLKNIFKE